MTPPSKFDMVIHGSRVPAAALGIATGTKLLAHVHRCVGGCHAAVAHRGDWCSSCAAAALVRVRNQAVDGARESISPEGARDWCRPGNDKYEAAIRKAVAATKEIEPKSSGTLARHVFTTGAWTQEMGNILIIGPTGFGKSKIIAAIGLGLIDEARRSDQKADLDFAAGILWVSGLELAKAREQWAFGSSEPPLIRRAKRATLLLIDEIGFEDGRDPHAIRDVMRARYEPVYRPTLAASGAPLAALHQRYGEPTVRMFWDIGDKGRVFDLFGCGARGSGS